MRFPYQRYQVAPSPTCGGELFRPEIPLRVIGASGDATVLALADTGSDDTLLPRSLADALGAALDHTQRWRTGGIAGQEVEVVLGHVEFALTANGQTFCWRASIGFVAFAQPEDEVAILGQAGFLAFFTAVFDGDNHELELAPNASFAGTVS